MTYVLLFLEEPVFEPMPGSARSFELMEDFRFSMAGLEFVIPKGFTTDFASIPQRLESFLDNDNPAILRPSIVHDAICDARGDIWGKHYSSFEAAEILRDGMEACGASEGLRDVVFMAVALEGPHWK